MGRFVRYYLVTVTSNMCRTITSSNIQRDLHSELSLHLHSMPKIFYTSNQCKALKYKKLLKWPTTFLHLKLINNSIEIQLS
jgi:hypothetical protein